MNCDYDDLIKLVSQEAVSEAWPLLEVLPFPIFLIDEEYKFLRINRAGKTVYDTEGDRCYQVTHGYDSPCDKNGERCPMYASKHTGETVSLLHVHQTRCGTEKYKVIGIPLSDSSMLEFHIPLNDVSIVDPLTGMLNRAEGEQSARRSVALMQRMESDYAVVLLDIDHFKQVNDTYGHPVGDIVLNKVAETLLKDIRLTDIAVRWGGEEFLLLLPDTTASQAEQLADRLLREVGALRIPIGQNKIEVSLSVGIRHLSFSASLPVSFNKVVMEADRALYEAKNTGRNKLIMYKT